MAKDIPTLRDQIGDKGESGSRIGSRVRDRVESVTGKIGDVLDDVKAAVSSASDTVGSVVGDRAQTVNTAAADRTSGAAQQTQRALGMARENPIGLTLAALAIGYLIGSILPVSDIERERLGRLGERVVDQAQATSHDLVEAGKAIVTETAQSVVSTALSSVKTHGQEVVDAAKARAEQT